MPRYRFYIMDEEDHVTARHEIQYLDDELAVIGAAEEFPGATVEIWRGARCILTNAYDQFRDGEACLTPASMVV